MEMDKVLFSDLLPVKFPGFYLGFSNALDKSEIEHGLIKGTKDIWCRDYMPVRRNDGRYLLFNYDPSYLKPHWQKLKTPGENIIGICKHLEIDFIDLEDIKLDGGNMVMGSDHVIMTDAVYSENGTGKNKQKQSELLSRLTGLFDSEIIIIPRQQGDPLSHADGVVRFLDSKTVLVNDFSSVTNKRFAESLPYLNSFYGALGSKGLDMIHVPYEPQEGKTKDGLPVATGIYINYLETGKAIFLPQFGGNLKEKDAAALDHFKKLFAPKGKAVVPVRCADIAREGGVLNCVSWN